MTLGGDLAWLLCSFRTLLCSGVALVYGHMVDHRPTTLVAFLILNSVSPILYCLTLPSWIRCYARVFSGNMHIACALTSVLISCRRCNFLHCGGLESVVENGMY